MTEKFIEGGVYVDDKTGAVYVCTTASKENKARRESGFLRAITQNTKNIAYITEENIKPNLRPWQPSDEAKFYDEKRWGNVSFPRDLNKVFKLKDDNFEFTFGIPVFYHIEAVLMVEVTDYSFSPRTVYVEDFINLITRPAFPNEIAGLTLPQVEVEI